MTRRIIFAKGVKLASGSYLIGVLFLIVLLAVYLPVVSGYYLYADDYLFLFPKSIFGIGLDGFWMNSVANDWLNFSISTGKPLYFLFIMLGNLCIENIESANLFRFGAIVSLALFSTLNWIWLVRHQVQAFEAFVVVVIIVSLPSFNLTVAWITMSGILPSLILAILASLLVYKSIQASSGVAKSRWRCGAVVAMVAALSTYQLSAMYYWVMLAITVLSIGLDDWKKSREMIAKYFLVGIFSMILYIFVGRIVPHILGVDVSGRGNLDLNVLDKFGWFVSGPTFNALNFMNLFPSMAIAIAVIAIIGGGIVIEYIVHNAKTNCARDLKPNKLEGRSESVKLDSFDYCILHGIAISALLYIHYLLWQVIEVRPTLSRYISVAYGVVVIEVVFLLPLYIANYSAFRKSFHAIGIKLISVMDEYVVHIAQKWLLVVVLAFLCCSPFLLSAGGKIDGQRVLIAYSPLIVILLFNGYKRICMLVIPPLKIALLSAFLLFGISCAWSARYVVGDLIVRPQTIEARYMLSELQRNYSVSVEEIHVFRPHWWTGMVPFSIPHGFEIGSYSSSVSSNIKNMVLCMLHEINRSSVRDSSKSIAWENVRITSSINGAPQSRYDNQNDPIPDVKPNVLFINMQAIR